MMMMMTMMMMMMMMGDASTLHQQYLVSPVLAAGHDQVVDRVPIALQHGALVRLPLGLLGGDLQRLDHQAV
jgi:hypothetical protein